MKTNFFHLAIIPINKILPHEVYDKSRSKELAVRLKKDKMIYNPIVVTNLTKDTYIQLDGMNRLSTFKVLKLKSILCQIVDYQDMDNVELASWLHLIKKDFRNFTEIIKSLEDVEVRSGAIRGVKNRFVQSEGADPICMIVSEDLKVMSVICRNGLMKKLQALNKIVSLYHDYIVRDVLPQQASVDDLKFLFKKHPECQTMIVFPTFTRHQIIKVVKKGGFFPAGITRHVIKKRCLNVNLPLAVFESGSVEEQNRLLEERLFKQSFRLYEEPTVYFE